MTSLLGKSSLYDMLACIIPGYLLLLLAKLLFVADISWEIDNVSFAIGAFTLSYLTGLLIKWLMEKVLNDLLRNSPTRIRKAYKKSSCIFEETSLPDNEDELIKLYYIAYYKAIKGNLNSSIPTLEAQIAFLRSILPIIFLYLATSYCWSAKIEHGYCVFIVITIAIFIGCIVLIWHLQDKLHQLVWEDAYYADLIAKSITPTNNP